MTTLPEQDMPMGGVEFLVVDDGSTNRTRGETSSCR
jgi:hypothetical protein